MKIETLALAIQKDFDNVHAEIAEMKAEMGKMATKDELRSAENRILSAIESFRKSTEKSIEKMDARLSMHASRTDDLDVRLRVVEKRG
jgi:hypothetical protein